MRDTVLMTIGDGICRLWYLPAMAICIIILVSSSCAFSEEASPLKIHFDYADGLIWHSIYIYNFGDTDLNDVIIQVAMRSKPGGKITEANERRFNLIEKDKKVVLDNVWGRGISVKNYVLKINIRCKEGNYEKVFLNNVAPWFSTEYNWVESDW